MFLFLHPPPLPHSTAVGAVHLSIYPETACSRLLSWSFSSLSVTPLVLPIKAACGLPNAVPAVPQSRGSGGVPAAAGGSRVLQPSAVHRTAGGLLSAGSAGVGGPLLPAGGTARTSNAAQSG